MSESPFFECDVGFWSPLSVRKDTSTEVCLVGADSDQERNRNFDSVRQAPEASLELE